MNKTSGLTIAMVTLLIHVTVTYSASGIDEHVHQVMQQGEDNSSPPTKRLYELYSRKTGKQVQILGKKVNANGASGGRFAKLEISSISFGGRITIKGVASGRYLCMNKRGRLIGKRQKSSKRCKFTENFEHYFDTFTNLKNPKWYVAFQRNGKPKKGPKTASGQHEVMFMKKRIDNVALTTSSPSAVGEDAWTKLEHALRSQWHSRGDMNIDDGLLRPTMMRDDPKAVTQPSIPFDIQREINLRKYQSMLSQQSATKTNKLLKNPRSKKHSKKQKKKKSNKKGKRRKQKKRREKPTQSVVQGDFDITSSPDRIKQTKTSRIAATVSSTVTKDTATFTIPSLLRINRTSQPGKRRNKKRTGVKQTSQKSRNRKSSRRRKKNRDVT